MSIYQYLTLLLPLITLAGLPVYSQTPEPTPEIRIKGQISVILPTDTSSKPSPTRYANKVNLHLVSSTSDGNNEVKTKHASPRLSTGTSRPTQPLPANLRHLATTDSLGAFNFSLPQGSHTLRISGIGYKTKHISINTKDILGPNGEIDCLLLEIEPIELTHGRSAIQTQDGITIQGYKHSHYIPNSEIKMSVITSQHFERNQVNNLMDAVNTISGLMQQIDCGVCYTNSIRINGMPGPYTTILIDGIPIIGALASVYGLNGINPSLIDKIEITKGPTSVVNGSEAIGGVINIITKSAKENRLASLSSFVNSDSELAIDGSNSILSKLGSTLVSGSYWTMNRYIDKNSDNFSDSPNGNRISLFAKHTGRFNDQRELSVSAKAYLEDRSGGVKGWNKSHKGSDSVYGEYIKTERIEFLSSYRMNSESYKLEIKGSSTLHKQNSYYGDVNYKANQYINYLQLVGNEQKTKRSTFQLGAGLKHDRYIDKSPVNSGNYSRITPHVFVENTFAITSDVSTLLGVRLDHHKNHGSIISPVFNLKANTTPHQTIRLSVGTGFRLVNLVTEDHAALSGSREVIIVGQLSPERSVSSALNLNQIVEFGLNNMMIDFDAFYTRFHNKIVPDYDTDPSKIYYSNSKGHSIARGASLFLNQNFYRFPLLYSLGINYQEVFNSGNEGSILEKKVWETFVPKTSAVATIGYTFKNIGLGVDYTGTFTGSKPMPKYADQYNKSLRSPSHSIHDIQVSWSPSSARATKYGQNQSPIKIFVTAKNIFNFIQGTPLIESNNPYSDGFDTNYIWGPIRGRTVGLTIRITPGTY